MLPPTAIHPNGTLYCRLMEQLKWRVETVLDTLKLFRAQRLHFGNVATADFCLLQLRFACELLALGCIAVHTDVPQTKRLQKMWNADLIFGAFEKLKPEFFPIAGTITREPDSSRRFHRIEGALTKQEMTKMYNFFGNQLHAGTFEKYEHPKSHQYDFKIIDDFIEKLMKLLEAHAYQLYDQDRLITVWMRDSKTGRVTWRESRKLQPQSQAPQSSAEPQK